MQELINLDQKLY